MTNEHETKDNSDHNRKSSSNDDLPHDSGQLRSYAKLRRWQPDEEPHRTMIEVDFWNAVGLVLLIGAFPFIFGSQLFYHFGLLGFIFGEMGFLVLMVVAIYYTLGDEPLRRM